MDIVFSRRAGIPLREQLVTQIEMKILSGRLTYGERLPSVRALARRLKVHPNTVSAAYQDLQAAGRVEMRRGAGVYVRSGGQRSLQEAQALDEMLRMALLAAMRRGFTGREIRAAVERWLEGTPPQRVVVIDPVAEMAELLRQELEGALGVKAVTATVEQIHRDPGLLSGALGAALPYHMSALRQAAPGANLEPLTLRMSEPTRKAILALAPGGLLLCVSHSPSVLPFATILVRGLRGDEILVEPRLLSALGEWRPLIRGADLVFCDAISAPVLKKLGAARLHEFRVVSEEAVARLREALTVIAPKLDGGRRAPKTGGKPAAAKTPGTRTPATG